MYYVIHSKDPYLLARFCTELQMEGCYPMDDDFPLYDDWYKWIAVYHDWSYRVLNHDGMEATRFTLTSRNYTQVLETVLLNRTASDAEKGGEG